MFHDAYMIFRDIYSTPLRATAEAEGWPSVRRGTPAVGPGLSDICEKLRKSSQVALSLSLFSLSLYLSLGSFVHVRRAVWK